MWALDYLDDIDSDMSAMHRVDDARTTMPAPLYFARAERLAAYPGVMQARVRKLEHDRHESGEPAANTVRSMPDDVLLAQLANEGWAEHNVEGADTA